MNVNCVKSLYFRLLVLLISLLVFIPDIYCEETGVRAMLSNPDATVETVALYNYLQGLTHSRRDDRKLIVGHWTGASFRPGVSEFPFNMGEVLEMRRQSGKWIGMIDAWICPGSFGNDGRADLKNDPIEDCMWYDQMLTDYQIWWRNGGICHVDASFFAPLKNRYWLRFEKKITKKIDYDNIFIKGTGENRLWIQMCDRISEFFLALQEKNIPVIFRPFTEAYISHFWYSNGRMGGERFKKLYIQLYNYLTETKGCNNIIWDFQGDQSSSHYPGDEYVDILTTKSDYVTWASCCNQCIEYNSAGKVVGNAELGDYGINDKVELAKRRLWNDWIGITRNKCPDMAFYITWDRKWGPVKRLNADGNYSDYDTEYNLVINNPYVITRDEIDVTPKAPLLPYENNFDDLNEEFITFGGEWYVTSGKLMPKNKKVSSAVYFGNTDWADYRLTTNFEWSGNGSVAVRGRCAASDIFYQAEVINSHLVLSKCFNGKLTELARVPFGPGRNDNIKVDLSFNCDNIDVEAVCSSGKKVSMSAVDATIPVGCAGLSASDSNPGFEYIKVYSCIR